MGCRWNRLNVLVILAESLLWRGIKKISMTCRILFFRLGRWRRKVWLILRWLTMRATCYIRSVDPDSPSSSVAAERKSSSPTSRDQTVTRWVFEIAFTLLYVSNMIWKRNMDLASFGCTNVTFSFFNFRLTSENAKPTVRFAASYSAITLPKPPYLPGPTTNHRSGHHFSFS